MRKLSVDSTDTRTFRLLEGESELATLTYANWFSFKAQLHLASGAIYPIEPKGFWGTTIQVMSGQQVLVSFKMHWNGSIILEAHLDDQPKEFVFNSRGLFNQVYSLKDNQQQQWIALQPDFSWRTLNYNYWVEAEDIYTQRELNDVMVLIAVHCANYYISMMSSASS